MATELIHTMIRVVDEKKSIDFYSAFGFSEIGRSRVGGVTATVIFLALPGDGGRLELTLNDGRTEPYTHGDGFGHLALLVDDMDAELGRLADAGISPEKEPYEAYPGGPKICFVRDPDGYRVELLTRNPAE